MKPVDKKQLLQYLEHRVEGHISEVTRVFQNLDDTALNKLSLSGGWSIAQCLDHLNSYGDYYLPLIGKELEAGEKFGNSSQFTGTWLGAYFIRLMEPESGKRKYKAFKAHIPQSALNASEVVAEFVRQQEEMLVYLRRAADSNLDKIKIPISIGKFIRLRLGDVFQFIIAHNERHLRQAKRNLEPEVATLRLPSVM
jgi:hypothetical protein